MDSLARAKFDLSFKYGQGAEASLSRILGEFTVEVKRDQKSDITGNLCIEFEQLGPDGKTMVPSGIAVSEADYWAFYWDKVCWLLVPRAYIRTLALEFYKKGCVKRTGDNGNRSVLVPVKRLLPGSA